MSGMISTYYKGGEYSYIFWSVPKMEQLSVATDISVIVVILRRGKPMVWGIPFFSMAGCVLISIDGLDPAKDGHVSEYFPISAVINEVCFAPDPGTQFRKVMYLIPKMI